MMRRFYATSTPQDGNEPFLCDTAKEALERATELARTSGKIYYVAQIIRRVEKAPAPMKVTVVKN